MVVLHAANSFLPEEKAASLPTHRTSLQDVALGLKIRPSKNTRSAAPAPRTAKPGNCQIGTACYPCAVKVTEILRLLQQDGWVLVATRGSHRQYKHSSKPGRVTVPGKPSDDLAPGTQNSILKQAGLK
jgi:predicted RNA binding protein YcfA (HicA-like mRNA interferase family)